MSKVLLLFGELALLLCGVTYSLVIAVAGNCTTDRWVPEGAREDLQAQMDDVRRSTEEFFKRQSRKQRPPRERKPIEQKEPGPPVEFADQASRTWTSADGKFTVKAKVTQVNPEKQQVTLQKESGETITIEIKVLSLEDRNHIRQLAR